MNTYRIIRQNGYNGIRKDVFEVSGFSIEDAIATFLSLYHWGSLAMVGMIPIGKEWEDRKALLSKLIVTPSLNPSFQCKKCGTVGFREWEISDDGIVSEPRFKCPAWCKNPERS